MLGLSFPYWSLIPELIKNSSHVRIIQLIEFDERLEVILQDRVTPL